MTENVLLCASEQTHYFLCQKRKKIKSILTDRTREMVEDQCAGGFINRGKAQFKRRGVNSAKGETQRGTI